MQVRAVGSRPIALASATDLFVFGAIDASSHRQDPGAGAGSGGAFCPGSDGDSQPGSGGGGGGGGATGASGGQNSNGSMGGTGGAARTSAALDGGCEGGSGGLSANSGGPGGGAVLLNARQSVIISGVIHASGAGGRGGASGGGGGGGGGSGGTIEVDAAEIALDPNTTLATNGGGGGEANDADAVCASGTGAGEDGVADAVQAKGGDNGCGPVGGLGGADTAAPEDGAPSNTATAGGGGGGGSAGVIRLCALSSTDIGAATISPPDSACVDLM